MLVSHDKHLLDYGYPLHSAVRGGHKHVVGTCYVAQKGNLVEKFTPAPQNYKGRNEKSRIGQKATQGTPR